MKRSFDSQIVIPDVRDLDLEQTLDCGQSFRWEKQDDGSFSGVAFDKYVNISLDGTDIIIKNAAEDDRGLWYDYFDLALDYGKIREDISRIHPVLKEAAKYAPGIRILRQDPYEALCTFIISQNKNIPAIKKSIEMLSEMAGERKTDRRGETYYAFPTPERIAGLSGQELSDCRLGYRCKYVSAAAEAVLSGSLELGKLTGAGDEEALAALKGIYGVGTKVANCVLLFGLHHLNAFPVDVWIKKVLEEQYPGGYPYEEYSPWNGIYQQYMFAYYRNGYILTV